jgi:hypothetical protein
VEVAALLVDRYWSSGCRHALVLSQDDDAVDDPHA